MASRASKRVIYAALVGNLLVALTKFVAAGLTGSSAMASEAVHSLVDTGNEVLLLYGLRRAARPPDELHPLGHGRELYFWSFVVTILIFAARESKGLLIGEPASSEVVSSICAIARAQPGVERANALFTVHLGPEQVVAAITADFADTISAADVEAIVAAIEDRVRMVHPEIVLLLIKPQSGAALARTRRSAGA